MFERFAKKGLTPEQARMKETLVFFTRLMIFAAPLYLIIFFIDLYPLQALVAGNSYLLLEVMGLQPMVQGAQMQVGDFVFFISKDSTAWKSMLFLPALMFAVPGILPRKRLIGLVGIPLVYLGNIGRVIGIVMAEQAYGAETAMLVHDWLWRAGLVVLVLGIWIVWLRWARSSGRRK